MRKQNEEITLPKLMKEFHFTVERVKIQEFAKAIGLKEQLYFDVHVARQAGHRDIPAPLTYGTVPEMWQGIDFEEIIETLGLDLLRTLHGEQSFRYYKQMYAGDELIGRTYLVHTEEKMKLSFFTFETTFYNKKNEAVLSSRSVVIERGGNE